MGGYQAAAAFRWCEIEGTGREGCFFYGGWQRADRTSPALRAASPFQGEAEEGWNGFFWEAMGILLVHRGKLC